MLWLNALEDRISDYLEWLITFFFFGIFCLTVMLVLLRYGFNSSIIWGSEAMNYLFIYCTALGAAASVSTHSHIQISYFKNLTSGLVHKFLNFLVFLLIGCVNAVLGWFSLPWIESAGAFESPVMRIPMWVVQIVVPVGCFLACLFCILQMIRILTGTEPKRGED